jgi:hypothetical protein
MSSQIPQDVTVKHITKISMYFFSGKYSDLYSKMIEKSVNEAYILQRVNVIRDSNAQASSRLIDAEDYDDHPNPTQQRQISMSVKADSGGKTTSTGSGDLKKRVMESQSRESNSELMARNSASYKRGRMMLGLMHDGKRGAGSVVNQNTQVHNDDTTLQSSKASHINVLSSVDDIKLTNNRKKQCLFCVEYVNTLNAFDCGHVSCEICCKKLLKEGTCPLCKKAISIATTKRVILKV